MSIIGNLLWFILGGGFFSFLIWIVIGLIFMITIIGIPFGRAAFRIAGFAAFPFGKDLIDIRLIGEKRIFGTSFANFIWILFAGFWLAVVHMIAGVCSCLTIIGIPFGLAHFKLAYVSFSPLGKKTVSNELAVAAKMRKKIKEIDSKFDY